MCNKTPVLLLCLCLMIVATLGQLTHKSGYCPLKGSVKTCMPKCVSDNQCLLNQKCCPNMCGSTSCTSPSAVSTGNDYKGYSSGGSVTCAGVRCRTGEKCLFDRKTKREKCTLA